MGNVYRRFSRRGTHPVHTSSRRHVGFFCVWRSIGKARKKNNKICFNFLLFSFEQIKLTVSEYIYDIVQLGFMTIKQ